MLNEEKTLQSHQIPPRKLGFSLVEAILALLIFSALISIGAYHIKDYQRQTEEKVALKQFEAKWNQALTTTYLKKVPGEISFDDRKIHFTIGSKRDVLLLPRTLKAKFHETLNINNNGTTGPQTICFEANNGKTQYFYTVQMNWGVLIAKNP